MLSKAFIVRIEVIDVRRPLAAHRYSRIRAHCYNQTIFIFQQIFSTILVQKHFMEENKICSPRDWIAYAILGW